MNLICVSVCGNAGWSSAGLKAEEKSLWLTAWEWRYGRLPWLPKFKPRLSASRIYLSFRIKASYDYILPNFCDILRFAVHSAENERQPAKRYQPLESQYWGSNNAMLTSIGDWSKSTFAKTGVSNRAKHCILYPTVSHTIIIPPKIKLAHWAGVVAHDENSWGPIYPACIRVNGFLKIHPD